MRSFFKAGSLPPVLASACLGALLALSGPCAAQFAQPHPKTMAEPSSQEAAAMRERKFDELTRKAEAQGEILVLVILRDPEWEPEGKLERSGAGLVEAQQKRIFAKQQRILGAIEPARGQVRWRHGGGELSLSLNARQISILRTHPDVSDIGEPRKLRVPAPG